MKTPFFLISFGDFTVTKRLFFYEKNGTCMLPVFNEPIIASRFMKDIMERMRELGDERLLTLQICHNPDSAIEMFTVIMTYITDLRYVVINPVLSESEDLTDITEFYTSLQSNVRNDVISPSDSK